MASVKRAYSKGSALVGAIATRRNAWRVWDWSKSNRALARERGLSHERIRQIRQLLGLRPRSEEVGDPRLRGLPKSLKYKLRYKFYKEELRASARIYYASNRESVLARGREWRLRHPEAVEAYHIRRRTGRRKTLKQSCPAIWAMISAEKAREYRMQNLDRIRRVQKQWEHRNRPAVRKIKKAAKERFLRRQSADDAIQLLLAASKLRTL